VTTDTVTGYTVAGNAVTFEELITAATVGVTRKPLPLAAVRSREGDPETAADPATALLDAAAMATVARRAGYQPPRGITAPDAPAETAPAFSDRAARALREACDWKPAGGFPADNPLLADLLGAAAGAGYVAPPLLLPALLDAAVRRKAVRPEVADVLGARGRWLADHRPDWRQAVRSVAPAAAGPDLSPDVWRTGLLPQRRAYLAHLRHADPDTARDLLAAGWAQETGADRGQLISVLADGLSRADEEFLEAALDDRHGTVRAAARRLLGQLPGSAFSQRADRRADGVLRVERIRGRQGLVATLPGEPDGTAVRDGITARPPVPSIGAGAWLLAQVIAAAPLAGWTARLALPVTRIAGLPVAGGLGPDVHAGFRRAAVTQGDADWARALLAADGPGPGKSYPAAVWPSDQALAALLPPGARAARAAALLANLPLTTVNPPGWAGPSTPLLDELTQWPAPWPEPVAEAAASVLVRAAAMPNLPHAARMVIAAAARCLPATGPRDYAAWITRLADTHEQTWSAVLHSAAATIRFRRAFLEEIRPA
jgi:hypothetical protein